ncbi:MAG: DUF3604 domain-containing protein [Rhodospirillales bacterium]|nr:MAG: DUF3604 domain-containing protein [Rhodospirillales bacterium]
MQAAPGSPCKPTRSFVNMVNELQQKPTQGVTPMRRHALVLGLACTTLLAGTATAQETQLYWGDTHLHTNFSPDAYSLLTTTADPDTSYRFAKGLPVIADLSRSRVQIDTPLDFLVVTDHAEYMGVIPELVAGNPALMKVDGAPRWSQMLKEGKGGEVFFELVGLLNTNPAKIEPLNSPEIRKSVWGSIVDTAETHNEPGRFTAFIGWEWSSLPDGRNLHRIVFTPDGKDKAMQYLPYSMLDSAKPRDLYNFLASTAVEAGTDFVAVAHNMNLSGGSMFPLFDESGNPIDLEYAELRERWEPVDEVTQYKGDSETHPKLSPDDPFADHETYEHALAVGVETTKEIDPGDYARTALMRGLQLENNIGKNPYKFGMIGATDSHTAFSSAEEDNFLGKYALDSIPENKTKTTVPGAVGWDAAAQGLAGVWATENTRDAITAAFKRREVYATTGPRISLRVFGGYDYVAADAQSPDLAAVGYRKGVPMGADLAQAPRGKVPSFLVHAAMDPKGANLDRIEIIKGWLDVDGKTHERIYDLALSDGRTDGSRTVGNTVDLKTGMYTNSIGDPELVAVWTDPDFDPGLRSFYYVRVLQIPTPRHSLYDAIALGIDPVETKHPSTIQERAYSSPIWYTPGQDVRKPVARMDLPARGAMTVESVLADGFVKMTGADIMALIGRELALSDLNSGAQYQGKLLESGRRVLTQTAVAQGKAAQSVYHGGDPLLMGETGYEIKGDAIVSSDGMRTVTATLFRKGDRIVATRDVDQGRVNYEIAVK